MSSNKTVPTKQSVTTFIDSLEDEQKKHDCYSLLKLMKEVTGSEPKIWGNGMIGFDEYHYKYSSGREGNYFKIGFSPRKKELSIYILPGLDRFRKELEGLGKYRAGKSCLYVKKLDDINLDILRKIMNKSTKLLDEMYG